MTSKNKTNHCRSRQAAAPAASASFSLHTSKNRYFCCFATTASRFRRWRQRHRVVARWYMCRCTHVDVLSLPFLCSQIRIFFLGFRSRILLLCGWLSIRRSDCTSKSFTLFSCCLSVLLVLHKHMCSQRIALEYAAIECVQLTNCMPTQFFVVVYNTIGHRLRYTTQTKCMFGRENKENRKEQSETWHGSNDVLGEAVQVYDTKCQYVGICAPSLDLTRNT